MNNKIAIYLRLSLADGDLKKGSKDESNSIENQRMLLHDYIGKQEDLFGEMNFRKTIIRIIFRHSRDGYLLESMRMRASAAHLWNTEKGCSS